MKIRSLKWGVTLLLVAVMVMAGVLSSYPGKSQAAAKGTTYNVVLQAGSTSVILVSINDGASIPQLNPQETISFQMVVEAKAKTEKLKTGPASYYPVTIIAKSFKAPTKEMPMVGDLGMAVVSASLAKDAKGKLYISGGDVDVSQVMGEKKLTTKIGDGKVDAEGSAIIPIITVSTVTLKSNGKVFMQTKTSAYLTTGQSYTLVKGSKSGLEGKALPNDDSLKKLPQPLVGKPLDLNAKTGTLVATSSLMNVKNKTMGIVDYLSSQYWVMKIN